MKRRNLLLACGALVILAMAVGLILGMSDNPFRIQKTFTARFDEVRGIRERSKVTFLGLPAGYVSELKVEKVWDRPIVIATIAITRKNLAIPAEVRARVTPSVLGESTIALTLPEKLESEALLADGAVLDGTVGSPLESIVPEVDEFAQSLAKAKPTVLMLQDLLESSTKQLHELFIVEDEDHTTEFDRLMSKIKETGASISGPDSLQIKGRIDDIVSDMQSTAKGLRQLTATDPKGKPLSLQQTLEKFNKVMDAAGRMETKANEAEKILRKLGANGERVANDVNEARSKITSFQPTGIGKWMYKFSDQTSREEKEKANRRR